MNKNKNRFFDDYKILRDEIDKLSGNLSENHSNHMECKMGCDQCCIDYSIFPIEFFSIVNDIKENKLVPETSSNSKENVCIFLKKHICSIYQQRPIICRTHGLPLLFMNDNSDWELSACELNFTTFNFEEFTLENTFPQDKYNSKLFLLNKAFISMFQDKKYNELDLIPIKNLVEYL